MLHINHQIDIPLSEIEFTQIRASGPGGQNVNKVSTAVHLRFDVKSSSLPESCKEKLLTLRDRRVSDDGVIIIKAQQYRSLEKNRAEALQRLALLIAEAIRPKKRRIATRPSVAAKRKSKLMKQRQSRQKMLRRKATIND